LPKVLPAVCLGKMGCNVAERVTPAVPFCMARPPETVAGQFVLRMFRPWQKTAAQEVSERFVIKPIKRLGDTLELLLHRRQILCQTTQGTFPAAERQGEGFAHHFSRQRCPGRREDTRNVAEDVDLVSGCALRESPPKLLVEEAELVGATTCGQI